MARRKKGRAVHGIIVVDKPTGRSSNHVLQQVKRLFDAQKAGHTGSLDPLATGLLPICLGDATRISSYLLDADKRYLVSCKLGEITDSADSDGNVIATADVPEFDLQYIEQIIAKFVGKQSQVPPKYSALKLNGQPLYKLARQGIEIDIEAKAREITIYQLQLVAMTRDSLTLDVTCSKGTYIRSLVEDIGQQLGCGAHVTGLRRTEVAGFNLQQAYKVESLLELAEQGQAALDKLLMPSELALADWSEVKLSAKQSSAILHGQVVEVSADLAPQLVKLISDKQQFIGVGELQLDNKLLPKRIFSSQQNATCISD
jgi:tRNA pseudouridine55 synthase